LKKQKRTAGIKNAKAQGRTTEKSIIRLPAQK